MLTFRFTDSSCQTCTYFTSLWTEASSLTLNPDLLLELWQPDRHVKSARLKISLHQAERSHDLMVVLHSVISGARLNRPREAGSGPGHRSQTWTTVQNMWATFPDIRGRRRAPGTTCKIAASHAFTFCAGRCQHAQSHDYTCRRKTKTPCSPAIKFIQKQTCCFHTQDVPSHPSPGKHWNYENTEVSASDFFSFKGLKFLIWGNSVKHSRTTHCRNNDYSLIIDKNGTASSHHVWLLAAVLNFTNQHRACMRVSVSRISFHIWLHSLTINHTGVGSHDRFISVHMKEAQFGASDQSETRTCVCERVKA